MWLGPVTYTPGITNACASEPSEIYPTTIQNLYGPYIIGLDGQNIANVNTHCDNCALLTANGTSIIAHIVTYGTENGVDALDLSAEAQSALGLSGSNYTGTWQFCSCPSDGAPLYYEFDARQWNPQNFWYVRVWVRNSILPVTNVETNVSNGGWVATSQQTDGAWQSESGVDFSGGFQIRVTAIDGEQLVDTIPALTSLNATTPLVEGQANFQ
jgi:expansin (peptidoglycan-binding protein)